MAMLPVLRQAYKAALVSDITVLLEGETGATRQREDYSRRRIAARYFWMT